MRPGRENTWLEAFPRRQCIENTAPFSPERAAGHHRRSATTDRHPGLRHRQAAVRAGIAVQQRRLTVRYRDTPTILAKDLPTGSTELRGLITQRRQSENDRGDGNTSVSPFQSGV